MNDDNMNQGESQFASMLMRKRFTCNDIEEMADHAHRLAKVMETGWDSAGAEPMSDVLVEKAIIHIKMAAQDLELAKYQQLRARVNDRRSDGSIY